MEWNNREEAENYINKIQQELDEALRTFKAASKALNMARTCYSEKFKEYDAVFKDFIEQYGSERDKALLELLDSLFSLEEKEQKETSSFDGLDYGSGISDDFFE